MIREETKIILIPAVLLFLVFAFGIYEGLTYAN
jgi:hypothetical protein